jgi:hypothetical protein
VRFLFAWQFPLCPRAWRLVEGATAGLDNPLARAEDRCSPHIYRGSNGGIAQPVGGFPQNPRARQFACARLAATKHVFSSGSFFSTSIHEVFLWGHLWALLYAGCVQTLPDALVFIKFMLTGY